MLKAKEVSLTEGDTFEILLEVTDNLGREYEYQESYFVTEHGIEGEAMAMPAFPD